MTQEKLKIAKEKAKKIVDEAKEKAKECVKQAKAKAVEDVKKAIVKTKGKSGAKAIVDACKKKCKTKVDATKEKCKISVEKAKDKAKKIVDNAKTKKSGGGYATKEELDYIVRHYDVKTETYSLTNDDLLKDFHDKPQPKKKPLATYIADYINFNKPKIKKLLLTGCKLGDNIIIILDMLSNNKYIKELDIRGNDITYNTYTYIIAPILKTMELETIMTDHDEVPYASSFNDHFNGGPPEHYSNGRTID
jgi:vacuolar-type H+-ATPase subunit H